MLAPSVGLYYNSQAGAVVLWCCGAVQPVSQSNPPPPPLHPARSPEHHGGLHLNLRNIIHTLIISMTEHFPLSGRQE